MDAQETLHLLLDWQDRQVSHSGDSQPVALGSATGSDVILNGQFTSRHHAHIELRHRDYLLVDHSTNGTYVQTEDERVTHVHRDEVRLWGNGWLSLGEPLTKENAIRFQLG